MNEFGWKTLEKLEDKGLSIIDAPVQKSGVFDGKTFVITGKLSKPRKEISAFIKNNGGRVTGAVSKNTSYLVCNEPGGSTKSKKAAELNVPVISESDLEDLINSG
jgi:DNA ligase (NAD+)